MNDQILVIGGTGKTGRRVVERLQNKGENVRIASRKSSPTFDWNDSESYEPTLLGADKVYIVYHPDLAVPGAYESIKELVEAAQKVGVKKLVLLSGKGESEAEKCEIVVANSGLEYTLVRASWFNQNFSESFFLDPIKSGIVAMPMHDIGVPFVDADDIADVVVDALLQDELNGQTIEVTGPELISLQEAVSIIAKSTQRDIQFIPVSLEDYIAHMNAAQVPAEIIWLFEYLFTEVINNPVNHKVKDDIEKVLGRKAKSFGAFAKEVAETGMWEAFPVQV